MAVIKQRRMNEQKVKLGKRPIETFDSSGDRESRPIEKEEMKVKV